ncbi:MAG: hypothetical protein ACRDT1_03570, partial [Micromonosporaceae bacterium]
GQDRPTRQETANLIGHGLRRRYGPAPGPLPHLGAALFAVVLAAIGVATGSWLAWKATAPQLPTDTQALNVTRAAAPGLRPAAQPDRFDVLFDYDLDGQGGTPDSLHFPLNVMTGGDDYDQGWVDVTYRRPSAAVAGDVTAIRDRLAAAGWRVGPIQKERVSPHWPDIEFAARRGSDVLTVTTSGVNATTMAFDEKWANQHGWRKAPPERSVVFSFTRAEPAGVRPTGYAAGTAGMVLGWILAARISRLARQRGAGTRAAQLFLATLGLTATLPTSATAVIAFLNPAARPIDGYPVPYWAMYVLFPVSPTYTAGMVSLAASSALLVVLRKTAAATHTFTTPPAAALSVIPPERTPLARFALIAGVLTVPPMALALMALTAAIGAALGF